MAPPGENKTPVRPIRVPQDLWDDFGQATDRAKTDRSAAVRAFMSWYAQRPGAKMPKRPTTTDSDPDPKADDE